MYHGQQIRPRPEQVSRANPLNTTTPANTDINAALQNIVEANRQAIINLTASNDRLTTALTRQTHDTAFSKYPAIDLTTAHTDLPITVVRPVDWIQIWSDGSLDGMSIKIGTQSNQSLDFKQIQKIRVTDVNPEFIYFTNDVRPGRSKAIIFFVRGDAPLELSIAGLDISEAELAARLGSLVKFDRRGDVLWMDDFEDGISKWGEVSGGAGASLVASTDYANSGSVSAKLTTTTVAAGANSMAKTLPYPTKGKTGFGIYLAANANIALYDILLRFYDGTNYWDARARYTVATDTFSILVGGAQVNLTPTFDLGSGFYMFHFLKIVADSSTKKYTRLMINDQSYDLSNYAMDATINASHPMLYVLVSANAAAGQSNISSYYDDAIVTYNEP